MEGFRKAAVIVGPAIILAGLVYAFFYLTIGVRLNTPQMSVLVLISFGVVALLRRLIVKLVKRSGDAND